MSQSRRLSIIETGVNVTVGMIGNIALFQWFIGPVFFGLSDPGLTENFVASIFYLVWALCRGYGVRRCFVWLDRVMAGRNAKVAAQGESRPLRAV